MLSDRRQRILRALIEEYVSHALPVGSRTLTEQYHLGVSSATVRNELSALEEAGYITQPHTSAGRIPTDAGYREFVDDLLSSNAFSNEKLHNNLVERLRQSADALDDLMEQTSAELTRLTDCLSIITTPSIANSQIRQVSFVSLSNYQALILVVMQDGQVINHNVTFNEEVTPQRLSECERAIAPLFSGHALSEISTRDLSKSSPVLSEPLASLLIEEMIKSLRDSGVMRASRIGISSLLRKPEFHESSSLLPLMEVLEDDTVLFRVFEDAITESEALTVRIGQENSESSLSGVSVIAGSYGRGESHGLIAVIGPKRMDYTKVISAVRAAQDVLGNE